MCDLPCCGAPIAGALVPIWPGSTGRGALCGSGRLWLCGADQAKRGSSSFSANRMYPSWSGPIWCR